MNALWAPPLLFVLGMSGFVASSPYYTIIGPKVVRPNSEYNVAVGTSAISEPSTIYLEINGNLTSGGTFNVSQTTTVEPYATRIVKLKIGDVTPGTFQLVARGLSGIEFHNSTDLQYILKSYSVLVQTDRAVYKPGSKVLFRAIVLDSRLRPAQNGTKLDIHITDGKGNRVKQWKEPMDGRGVFSGELQLSNEPVLGDWKIIVQASDQIVEKPFQVAEYVLPKFEVIVDVPNDATFKDSSVTATIRAKYTYGKPVKGKATVTARLNRFYSFGQPSSPPQLQKVIPIDGKAVVNFDIVDELRITEDYQRTVTLDVTVEEELTGRRQNASAEMILRKHKYKIELIKTADSYKPGLKYTAFIKVARYDGSPVQDETNPVRISYGYNYDQASYANVTRLLDKHGSIQLDFYPPLDLNDTLASLNIEADYLNLHQWFSGTSQAASPSETYIQAVLKTENPTVSKDVEIEVNSTVPLKYLSYEVLGRGNILAAATLQVNEKNTATFSFPATYEMAPTAHVLVYYTRDDGEIVADALNVNLNGYLQNTIDVATVPEETKPGETVDLIVTSKPNSYVGLLGVDQSSVLLKSGNDISHEQILNELKSYDVNGYSSSDYSGWDSYYWSPGSASAYDAFDDSGAVVLTNGYVHRKYVVLPQYLYSVAYASEVLPGPVAARSPPPEQMKVRKNFPETWIWQMLDAGPEGRTVLRESVPDTITSWVLTAFSLDSEYGFGLIDAPRKLKVFQPFFVSLNLPYSIIRGEIVAIPIVVFNYLAKDLTAEVVLENTGEFEFAELHNEVPDSADTELSRKKRIDVKANSGTSVSFMILPKKLGQIVIKVTATSPLAGDSIEQQLLVKPEGETQYRNKALFVDLANVTSLRTNFTVDIPENAVAGSEHIEVSAVGDILGPSLPNLANLLKIPYGCGEQNMLNFVPNIVVLNYLKSTNQLTPDIEAKALKNLEIGYQQELTYRHEDGSFSAFGKSDASGSTWLTAFVAKSFAQASEHITIEADIINTALQWLAANQAANGSFPEVGKVSHSAMQGGAAKGLALTAFTLVAFLENQDHVDTHRATINKGVDYIVSNLVGLDDAYSLSLCTYVLNLAKHSDEDKAFETLESKAERKEDYKWWSKPVPVDNENPWYSLPSSVNVEMTSYALLTYLRRNMVADSLPIMKWLVSQRNAEGGFASTQDTVIGIYALSKLGEKLSSKNTNIDISFTYDNASRTDTNINSTNNMILQKYTLPEQTREVDVSATGTGFGIIQVSYNYNLDLTGDWPLFTLKPQVDKNSDANHLQLSICSGFIPTKEANESNMAVMEVSLPSGFAVDADSLESLKNLDYVKRVETKNGDTTVVLYFDKMVQKEYCPTVSAFRTHKVALQKPVPVSIYDYYDSSRRARVFYQPIETTLSDICEGENCGNFYAAPLQNQTHGGNVSNETAST